MPNGEEHERIPAEVAAANALARKQAKGVESPKVAQEQRKAERIEEIDELANPLREKLAAETISPAEKLVLEKLLTERGNLERGGPLN